MLKLRGNFLNFFRKLKRWGILRICNQKCSKLKLKIYSFTKSFFVDLVILNTFHNWNMLLKSIFTRQKIDKLFDDVVKNLSISWRVNIDFNSTFQLWKVFKITRSTKNDFVKKYILSLSFEHFWLQIRRMPHVFNFRAS